jgi:hypothetical protein
MADIIRNLFTSLIYTPLISLLGFLSSDIVWFYVLIFLFVVSIMVKGGIDKRIAGKVVPGQPPSKDPKEIKKTKIMVLLSKTANAITVVTILLIMIVGYVRYETQIKDFFSVDTTTTPTDTKTTPGTKTTPAQPATPTYTAPKQLYYAISCYGCWAEGCNRDGYNYSGYDSSYYSYYDNLCHVCSCNSINGRSFWK